MVLIQQTEATCPKVTFFRQHYAKIISDKHEDLLAKFGAILAQGIIDAGRCVCVWGGVYVYVCVCQIDSYCNCILLMRSH